MFIYLRKKLIESIAVVFVLNFLATYFNWYRLFWWFDMLMHFLGGLFVAWLVFYVFARISKNNEIEYDILLIKKVVLWSLVIGLGWEWFEWVTDILTGANNMHMLDSYSDIFFDLAGTFTALYIFNNKYINLENNKQNVKI